MMGDLIKTLFKIGLLNLHGIGCLLKSIFNSGLNLMTVLDYATRKHKNEIAVQDGSKSISYQNLYDRAYCLASAIKQNKDLNAGDKVVIISRNNISLLTVLFGLSRIEVDVFLMNTDVSKKQLIDFLQGHECNTVFCEQEQDFYELKNKQINIISFDKLDTYINKHLITNLKPNFKSKIMVLTGGTGGDLKVTTRKPSIFAFMNPLSILIEELKLFNYKRIYNITPIYHGYGLATVAVSFLLGAKIYLSQKFDTDADAKLISDESVEVITVVPLMLKKLLAFPEKLESLQCIICGGATLDPSLILETNRKISRASLYNLYGTTEAGFCILATPTNLKYQPTSIGKPIRGVRLAIKNDNNNLVEPCNIGQLYVSNNWSISPNKYINTGDMAYCDNEGYVYLMGRSDEMIISGGENVYPSELESVLLLHSDIGQAVVRGVDDDLFGQRLIAYIVTENKELNEALVLTWLQNKVARYSMPKQILFVDDIPETSVGKYNKNLLPPYE